MSLANLLYRISYSTIIRSSNIFFYCYHIMHKSVLTIGVVLSSLVILGVVIPFFNLNNVANANRAPPLPEGPIIKDSNLKAEVVFEGLTSPTSIAFVGPNDILVLEKDKGTVREL